MQFNVDIVIDLVYKATLIVFFNMYYLPFVFRDVTLQELVISLRRHKEETIDFNWLHEIGCSCDDTELPQHISSEEEITDLVTGVRQLLVSIPDPPSIITVARFVSIVQYFCICPGEVCFLLCCNFMSVRYSVNILDGR